ncbi:MAG: hypothetical protein J0I42_20315 [Bosea sp.]|nr:hypothetical protein [Bosea sp. (in: a-proteobacteria)]
MARIAGETTIHCNGREALTLLALVERGSKGVSGVDFPGGPAYRLGAYVFDLRGMGVGIETGSESHGIGTHARYKLTTPVEIVAVDRGTASGVAA